MIDVDVQLSKRWINKNFEKVEISTHDLEEITGTPTSVMTGSPGQSPIDYHNIEMRIV